MEYIVYTDPYLNSSAGVRATHMLVHLLNERGYKAYSRSKGREGWNEPPIPNEIKPDTIVVYPEVYSGNPLGLRNVVRWTLNKAGYLGGDDKYDPADLVFTWDTYFTRLPKDRVLSLPVTEHDLFTPGGERDGDRWWYGKGFKRLANPKDYVEGMEEITRDWPATREELAELLKRTNTLYTFDDYSGINLEAKLCGCRVILLPENIELFPEEVKTQKDYDQELDNFIKITQEWAI